MKKIIQYFHQKKASHDFFNNEKLFSVHTSGKKKQKKSNTQTKYDEKLCPYF